MPTVKNGRVSVNLKMPEEMYNRWVAAAAERHILNMSEFIRQMVEKGIKYDSKN